MGKGYRGIPHPQPTRGSGEHRKLPVGSRAEPWLKTDFGAF